MSSEPASAFPPGVDISELSGPLIIAYILHWGLFGTLSIQIYLYYLAFPLDRTIIKSVVYGIFLIEIIQTILVTHDAFAIFGYGFGSFESLTKMYFDWFTVPVMSGIVALIGQTFYAYRIRVVSKSNLVPAFIITVSLTSTIAAFMTGAYSYQAGNVLTLRQSIKTSTVVGIWCAGAALGDIVIALSQRDSGFAGTHAIVTKFIRLSIETGSVTAIVALLNFIFFFVFPDTGYYGVPALIMPKLYANSVLMVLNARIKIIGGRAAYISTFDVAYGTHNAHNDATEYNVHESSMHFRVFTSSRTGEDTDTELSMNEQRFAGADAGEVPKILDGGGKIK
ncbi:hypothetical protein EV368DRAFT_83742 [Lentinula lateritia]|uniref:Uncharacterized protein n=1 Tax=Lentinula aff. lateritia TaxID=2804960 RepID=A0ACC1U7U2_9AGAR|nr:hypothetical protein F5876DRAFT_74164 [Lentinula aff. lateritia]KAJ3851224.1 hypothetical protein EV368DRAFT_83742 [Lentinula lateritia]